MKRGAYPPDFQKGNEVEWFKGHKKGNGIISRVINTFDPYLKYKIVTGFMVKDIKTGDENYFTTNEVRKPIKE